MPGLPVRSPCSPLCVCASLSDHCSPAVHSAPRRSRTPSLLIRSQTLYPVELWALGSRIVNRLRCTDAPGRTDEQRQVGLFSACSLLLLRLFSPVRLLRLLLLAALQPHRRWAVLDSN